MSRFLVISMLVAAILLIIACGITPSTPAPGPNPLLSTLQLRTQAQPPSFTGVDQVITITYTVTYTGDTALDGPVTVTDTNTNLKPLCPELNTIGNNNKRLNQGETISCAAAYKTTQADVAAKVITSSATAHIGNQDSNTVTTTINLDLNKVLVVTVTSSPTNFTQANQKITFVYQVKNTGPNPVGPIQFVITDPHISAAPINCMGPTSLLGPNESLTCNVDYNTTQADVDARQIVSSATATAGTAGTLQPGTLAISLSGVPGPSPSGNSGITPGSTYKRQVKGGEWLLQIVRCYGASFDEVVHANPQIIDPNLITPFDTITIPHVGSVGPIYGEPCFVTYTVQTGDSWKSIADKPDFNAAVDVLMAANENVGPTPGQVIVIPRNSKGYGSGGVVNPPPRQPIPLTFSATNPKVVVQGTIGTPDTIHYVFTATTGQALTLKLTTPNNDVSLGVTGPSDAVVKVLDNNTSWSGTLNANGSYSIDLVSNSGASSKNYTLEATLATPTPTLFERVADINNGPGDSNPSYMINFNGLLFFAANGNDTTGNELWKYDPAPRAASRVVDINPGPTSSDPAYLVPFGNMLYFSALGNAQDNGGRELWRFNGTVPGRVSDINAGPADSNPKYLTVFKDALYFSATGNDNGGNELWKFDGTTSSRVTDINPGPADANPAYLAVFNGNLYFSAVGPNSAGTELWKFDGTNATLAADINKSNNGLGSSNPAFLMTFGNYLYFSADGGDGNGTELWRFDGTNATLAADINKGGGSSVPTYLTVHNSALYFSADGGDGAGFEIWKFDGTNATRVSNLNPTGDANPAYLTSFNNELYFKANANDGAGAELWKYKGP